MSIRHSNNNSYRICEHSNIVGLGPEEYCVTHAYAYLLPFRHQRERRTHLKQGTTIKILQTECQKDRFHPKQVARWLLKKKESATYMQRHTMTEIVNHSRSTALEPWNGQKKPYYLGGGGGGGGEGVEARGALIDFTWPQPSPLFLPWYTQDICSVRVKGFQLISAKSPRTQISNEYRNKTTTRTPARNTEMLKENQQLEHQATAELLKSL